MEELKSTNRVNAVSVPVNVAEPNSNNSTNSFNTASPSVNAISPNFRIARKSSFVDPSKYLDDLDMPELEDIVYLDDEEDVGADADLSNLETNIPISHILTTRVHKDHLVNHIISDLNSAPQTRSMTRMGHTQEEGIDYDEVFALVARIEAIWLFLAYASFMGFKVYQMNVKSPFLYETIKEEVYVCQPLVFKDPDYPDKVYKVVKALYGLHQDPRVWYKTLANYLLENSFQREKIDQTLFIKKQKEDILLVQVYVNDIFFGSTNKELCKAFDRLMKDKFQMSSMGELTFFLGLQTVVATSSTEAEWVVAASCFAQVLWIQNQLLDYGHFITDVSYELILFGLTKDAAINLMLLDDADGVKCFPNEEIFEDLAQMGYENPPLKVTFYKAFFSTQWKFLIHTLVQCLSRKFNFFKYIFDSMVRNVDSPSKFLMYLRFLQVLMDNQMDDMTSHNTRYTSPALTQKVFANMKRVGNFFQESRLLCLLQCLFNHNHKLKKKFNAPAPLSPTRGCIQTGGKIEAIDDDEKITLVDVETQEEVVAMDVEPLGRINQEDVNAVSKWVSATEPNVFDDEEVTMTMAQILVKLKAEKAKLLDEQIAQRLHDKEIQKVQERHLDNIKKYKSLKKKHVLVAQARKNMIIYLKNMAGYKMEHFKGMTYDKVRPIFEREYKKVQTLCKPDKDAEEPKKKRVDNETLLQESFKKLRAVEVLGSESTQEIPSNDPKEMTEEDVQNMLEIILVSEFKVEALQVKYPIID
nr:putative ribonuclease H-like domain-containing protein [Tanacetum cinerariifolium]